MTQSNKHPSEEIQEKQQANTFPAQIEEIRPLHPPPKSEGKAVAAQSAHTNMDGKPVKSSSLGTERLTAFSDGVFAVAITLLILNIELPNTPDIQLVAVINLWPKLISYILSFVIVGIYWVSHHNTFHYIRRSDRLLLWINLLLLMCIVFIPFPTGLLGRYPRAQIAVIVYRVTLIITGLVVQLLWWYATSNYRLIDQTVEPQFIRWVTRRNLTPPCIYCCAIIVSFIKVEISLIIFIIVPLLYILPSRIDRLWLHHRPPRNCND